MIYKDGNSILFRILINAGILITKRQVAVNESSQSTGIKSSALNFLTALNRFTNGAPIGD